MFINGVAAINVFVDWMRIGAFFFDSPCALLTEHLTLPKRLPRVDEDPGKAIQASGTCMLANVKTGIWIAGNATELVIVFHF